jgi:alpha-galactosidase
MNNHHRARSINFKVFSALSSVLSVLFILLALAFTFSCSKQAASVVWLDELGPQYAVSGWGETQANKSIDGNPLTIAGKVYERGLGTHAEGMYPKKTDGKATPSVPRLGLMKKSRATSEPR